MARYEFYIKTVSGDAQKFTIKNKPEKFSPLNEMLKEDVITLADDTGRYWSYATKYIESISFKKLSEE